MSEANIYLSYNEKDIQPNAKNSKDILSLEPIPPEDNFDSLFKLREFFLIYNYFFIFFKIFVGAIFLIVPIFLFNRILTHINNYPQEKSSDYFLAFIPLIVSISLVILYFTVLIIYKISSMFASSLYDL